MFERKKAIELLDKYVKDRIIRLHMIETEAIMRALARHLRENEEEWGIIGLLHDIDWDLTKEKPSEHCVKAVDILKSEGADDFLIEKIISHGYGHEIIPAYSEKKREGNLEHCLVAAETLTGLIVASALVQPDKKIASVKPESLKKKFNSPSFAAGCDREIIKECEAVGIPLDEFLKIGLEALAGIAGEIGL